MSRSAPPNPASQNLPHGARNLSSNALSSRLRTPIMTNGDHVEGTPVGAGGAAADANVDDNPRALELKKRYHVAESRLMELFRQEDAGEASWESEVLEEPDADLVDSMLAKSAIVAKKPARKIDEDDYGDDDDDEEEEEEEEEEEDEKPAKDSATTPLQVPRTPINQSVRRFPISSASSHFSKPSIGRHLSADLSKSGDEARKAVEEETQANEEAAKKSFHTLFFTLENDRIAMLEQQKLDELDRQVDAETLGDGPATVATSSAMQTGSLSSSNLGASNLMLSHLLSRIDSKRNLVHANDAQLRRLISEVRKNRSKWASEDKVGQEELYESAEKVLQNLKALTEYSVPFLQRVSKREAPDYYNFIKNPMDIGTMMKKLKSLQYKSKKEFVDDLHLIWNNCLKYNTDPNHVLRKKALFLQKKTDEFCLRIPEVVVRDRAEVEAEERRNASLDADLEGIDDSDDEPLANISMNARGRKAPSKSNKGGSTARKAPAADDGTPVSESKPNLHSLSSSGNLKNQYLRADSDVPMENGFGTPPLGRLTPVPNGVGGEAASQADASEAEGGGNLVNDMATDTTEYPTADDLEHRLWKQVTKTARASIASQRNRLFRADRLNGEEPAILRTKAGMRRWMRQQKKAMGEEEASVDPTSLDTNKDASQVVANETLAEAMEAENDTVLPDYYDPISAIPEIDAPLKWEEDTEGNVVIHSEEVLRMLPAGHFTSPDSILRRKMNSNMRQIQETRKVCAKIGVVKQMQLQTQMYSNQFQRFDPQPLIEQDIEPTVVSDEGPFMAPWVCRAAFQRSIAEIFYHAGFEEFQPSALDAVTDAATTFFSNVVQAMTSYAETSHLRESEANDVPDLTTKQPHTATFEENVLHALDEQGLDVDALESYVKEDVDRLGTKLGVMHERMKAHLADLLRPALDPSQVGTDGVGAFIDGSEQFESGDFAEEIGEDFFGFKELGLDSEFSMTTLSVPFHLLHSRMHNAYAATNTNATVTVGTIMETPPNFEPVTLDNIQSEIGLIHSFFMSKFNSSSSEEPLIEDDELPIKQRFPKPRLPPTGKISSPRKRPIREQQQMAKKKRKLEEGKEEVNGVIRSFTKPAGKLRLDMPPPRDPMADPEKDDDAPGMMSPESM